MAPMFWGINRKEKRFVITVRPGSHPKNNSIPTAVLLRDTLKKVKTLREAKSSIYGCLLYTSPSPRDGLLSRMPSSA